MQHPTTDNNDTTSRPTHQRQQPIGAPTQATNTTTNATTATTTTGRKRTNNDEPIFVQPEKTINPRPRRELPTQLNNPTQSEHWTNYKHDHEYRQQAHQRWQRSTQPSSSSNYWQRHDEQPSTFVQHGYDQPQQPQQQQPPPQQQQWQQPCYGNPPPQQRVHYGSYANPPVNEQNPPAPYTNQQTYIHQHHWQSHSW